MKRWSDDLKEKVRVMRLGGSTYSQIRQNFQIPKSTLSEWCRELPRPKHLYFENRRQWLEDIRKISSESIKRKRNLEVEMIAQKVKQEVKSWDFLGLESVQKSLLGILYWAEGQKLPLRGSPVKFVNTDPRLVLLFLTLLRNCYQLDESKLRVRLHLHWYHNIGKIRKFWSELLGIDESRFGKVYIKRRSKTKKFRKNFAGICFVIYYDVDLRWEVVHTGYNVQGVITGKVDDLRP